MKLLLWFVILICGIPFIGLGQAPEKVNSFDYHYKKGIEAMDLYLYEESLYELNLAIEIAKDKKDEKELIAATITWAELMRKTDDYDKGIEKLLELKQSEDYPELHVRKLGRLAALYMEKPVAIEFKKDSIITFLEEALVVAKNEELIFEEAKLTNELGYLHYNLGSTSDAIKNFEKSADLFQQLGNERHLTGPFTNLLRLYVANKEFQKADSIREVLFPLLTNNEWYSVEADVYQVLFDQAKLENDSMEMLKWELMAVKSSLKLEQITSTKQLNSFRVKYETEKLSNEVKKQKLISVEKENELFVESEKTRKLIIYLGLIGGVTLILVGLFVRESRLKSKMKVLNQDLAKAVEKNQMLVKESNHRIKNNLQMVVSMIQYAKSGGESSLNSDRISAKINTISSLHKHLNLEHHNEEVSIVSYFTEIIKYYQDISFSKLKIVSKIDEVKIKSERIVYFGLILNELLSNTLEHSTANEAIELSVREEQEEYTFEYTDYSNISEKTGSGTGIELVKDLVLRIGAYNFELNHSTGHYQFKFKAHES